MLKATSTVAVSTPANGIPVPDPDRIDGLTITMYDIVTKVVSPATISAFTEPGSAGGFNDAGRPWSDAVTAKACGQDRLQVGFRSRAGEIEVRLAERIDQRANH